MLRAKHKRLVVAAAATTAVVAAGAGFAAWATNGSGTGYSKAATASAVTLGVATTTADLYPGKNGAALKLNVTNPNAFAVQITAVTGNGTITSDAGATCNSGHGVTLTDQTGLSLSLAAGATGDFSVTGAVSMSTSAVTQCQGATFSIPVTVTAASA